MDPFFNYLEKIDKRYPVWDLSLFFILIYLPILQRVYMELSIADLLTLIIAGITAVIAFITYLIAKESNNFAKFQLTGNLSLRLYELKDLMQNGKDNDSSGNLWCNFLFSKIISKEHDYLLLFIIDSARCNNFLNEEESEKLVNICKYLRCGPNSHTKVDGFKYNPKELRKHYENARTLEESSKEEEEINRYINTIIDCVLAKLKSHHY